MRYTRFVSARNKPIVETACRSRLRQVPPRLRDVTLRRGDFVEAWWLRGWWPGYVVCVRAWLRQVSRG